MIFYFKFVKLYISTVLCCLKIIKKKTVKTTTQYNTITQFNLVKFKVFMQKLYFVIVLYCIVLFLEQKKCNNTIQHNNNTFFFKFKVFMQKLHFVIVLCCFRNKLKNPEKNQQHNTTQ